MRGLKDGGRRLRVVYLGATFAPDKLMNGFLRCCDLASSDASDVWGRDVWWRHPASKVEVHCVAWDMQEEGARAWIREQVENFHAAGNMSDLARDVAGIAQLVNSIDAHLLVELVGWYPEQVLALPSNLSTSPILPPPPLLLHSTPPLLSSPLLSPPLLSSPYISSSLLSSPLLSSPPFPSSPPHSSRHPTCAPPA
eukprot:756828-Hanusia_phi.AAC.2